MATTLEQNQVISSQSMSPVPTIQPVTPTLSTVDPSIASNAIASIIGDFGALSQRQAEAQKEQEGIGQSTLALQNLLSGRTADTQSFENTAGVDTAREQQRQYAEQLANLNAQALSLQREAQAIPIQTEQESMGRGRTEAGVAPLNASRLRENALKALSIAQQADIASASLTGSTLRLQAAKEKAQQMVDLKYKPIEEMLALKKQQYELNKDTLEQLDKKRAEALSLSIKKEERELAERKDIETMVAEATPTAPANVIANARKIAEQGGSKLAVAQALGVYGGDYLKNELLKEQIAKVRSERIEIDTKNSQLKQDNAGVITAPNGDSLGGLPTNTLSAISKLKLGEGQANAVAFVSRMIQSDTALRKQLGTVKPEGGFYETTGYDPTSLGSSIGRAVDSDQARTYDRNAEDFIRAKLRKESGAVISPEEMEKDSVIYTPRGVGLDEKDLLLAQTKRDEAIKSMIAQAGPAAPYLLQYYNEAKSGQGTIESANPQLNEWYKKTSGAVNAVSTQAQSTYGFTDNQAQ